VTATKREQVLLDVCMPLRVAVTVVFVLLTIARLAQGAPQLPYYLALGDSLARGIQPLPNGTLVETNQGYVDDLYAVLRLKQPFLQLKKLGCSGETTTTMITGGVCQYAAGNQLAQAIAFLQTHRVALVTITIGGDNVLRCISKTGEVNDQSVDDGVDALGNDLPQIVLSTRSEAHGSA
jgi:lysophospholipase L1-like esterase